MTLTAIAAVGRNRAIGLRGDVPWHIPEDWKRFKAVTMGCSLIMGRKTFEAIGDPLPGRTSIVISRTRSAQPDTAPAADPVPDTTVPSGSLPSRTLPPTRVIRVSSLDEALAAADFSNPVWIGGGAEIYRLAWDRLTDLDLTEVDQSPEADAFLPEVDPADWVEVSRDQRDGYAFVRYRRR